ncbi:MAG TPA: peptide chain release factor 2 [Actinomycetota bacterium]|nr:peptide chain release factor 2 [Actinomycetota bacterium]
MSEHTPRVKDLAGRLASAKEYLDVEARRTEADALERQLSEPGVWDDPSRGQRLTTDLARIRAEIERYDLLAERLEEAEVLDQLLDEQPDPDTERELLRHLDDLEGEVARLELASLLGGEYDRNDAVASLHAGAGGTESQDWAEMLLRMYLRWAELEGLEAELDEVQPGEEAGIKSATFIIRGRNAYGLLSAERGVHRLVRISPFDAQSRRHTSFASLDVIPLIPEDEEIEIDPKDLRIDTYRSSGAGGQHVNVTDSAVRITHIPTGITAACQNERSQMQNRAVAMRILKARLADLQRRQREERIENLRGERRDIEFGSQIRSYVLHPYRMVKDHRTGIEIGNVDRVLDGDIEPLIEAELRRRASGDGGSSGSADRR